MSQNQVAGELAGEPLIEAWRGFVGSHGGTSYGPMGMVNLAMALREAGRKDEAQPLLVAASEQTNAHRAAARARITALGALYQDAKDTADAATADGYLATIRTINPGVAERLASPPAAPAPAAPAAAASTPVAAPPAERPFPPRIRENDVDGSPISLDAYLGKVVLIDFWATWCPPCRREIPSVVRAYEQFHDQGFEVIGVSLDSDVEAMRTFARENAMPWRQHCDGQRFDGSLVRRFGVQGIPTTFLLNREGRIHEVGLRGEALVEAVGRLVRTIDPYDLNIRPAYLGIEVEDADGGARVKGVNADGSVAGILLPGDVIRSFAGVAIDGTQTLIQNVRRTAAGNTVSVVIVREGTERTFEVMLKPRP